MYCCYEQIDNSNLGHVDVEVSNIEQNLKINDIVTKDLPVSKNLNINLKNISNRNNDNTQNNNSKRDSHHTLLSMTSQRFLNNLNKNNNLNSSNVFSINYNCKNDSINNSTRNGLHNGKANINIHKSDNLGDNSITNNQNGPTIIEDKKPIGCKESSNKMNSNYNYHKKMSIFSKMTDNFSHREDASNFTNLIYILNKRNITEEEILSSPKLKIVGKPIDFFYGKEILINAAGVMEERNIQLTKNTHANLSTKILPSNYNFEIQSNSIIISTNENKGITYFGQKNDNINKNFIRINYNRKKFSDYNKIDIFFYIYYLRETKKYYLNPNNDSIMFLKIKPKIPFRIKQGEYLSIDNAILILQRHKSGFNNYLSIDYNQENFIFKDEEYINNNKYIKIGRDKSCDIIIENRKSISRINVMIKYNYKDEEWDIYDGDEYNKESLNGVRILIKSQLEINEDCEIEFLGQRFEIHLI
jgi:hypothetical protein